MSGDGPANPGGDRFPATRRSVIDAVKSIDAEERAQALERVCEAYWRPVYKYIRMKWNRPAWDAQDLTQGFFVGLLERDLLARYEPDKSRLRTYLRACIDNFIKNEDKAGNRQKRAGGVEHLALDFAGAEQELRASTIDPGSLASPESLEQFFEKEWIRSLFTLAVEDLRTKCAEIGRERSFLLFEAYDLEGGEKTSYTLLALEYGIAVTDVTNALAWARTEFRRIALERLREICGTKQEFQHEARLIFGWEAG
ncbi:MAG TPA: sigma-70 family RNA polymerase sigma factor [Candidatus Saccharimonadales bacterium]|nr:sigma-70 family RNA polymerase sigma factor [Candidatus Saccharimonadales bacterium]